MNTLMQSASYNVQPLSEDELRAISGGFTWFPFFGPTSLAIGEIVKEWDNFKNGLAGRPERAL
jgi:hypothetical protein